MIKHLSIQQNPLFPDLNVLVLVGGTEEYWRETFYQDEDSFHQEAIRGEAKLFKDGDHDGYCKFTKLYKDGWIGDVPCILIHFAESLFDHSMAPDTFSNGVIAHECLHAAQYIMDEYEIGYHEKEFFTRIHQWLFTTISGWVYENFVQEDEVVRDRE